MKYYAIIVAGGSGHRMKTHLPKQFLKLGDKPVLMHTIERFYRSELQPEILTVLNENFFGYWKELCHTHHFDIPHTLIAGGKERFDSVKNALNYIQDDSVVAIHDAVRPVVTNELITRCFKQAETKGSAIPVTASRDSLRRRENNTSRAVPRDDIWIVQTPQTFQSGLLKEAYNQPFSQELTDDASVVEKMGREVFLTEGDTRNIKITYPEDVEVVSLFLRLNR